MKISVCQFAIRDGAFHENVKSARRALESAAGSDLAVLPELWSTGYVHEQWRDIARRSTSTIVRDLQGVSKALKQASVGSIICEDEHGLLRDRLFWVSGDDTVIYDKAHLIPAMREPEFFTPGTALVQTRLADVNIGLAICFDLRFPRMFRQYARAGCHLVVVPSEWPTDRADHLRLLCRARAVENQMYIAMCNRVGRASDGTDFHGGSIIVGPTGEILAELGDAEGTASAEIDPRAVDALREQFPVAARENPALDDA